MSFVTPIEPENASAQVRAVYDDIKATRKTDRVNNFWKVLANDPPTLARVWGAVKEVMAPGALDPLTKELIYIAVSVTNNCEYCIHSHAAGGDRQGHDRGDVTASSWPWWRWPTRPIASPTATGSTSTRSSPIRSVAMRPR